MSGRLLSPLAWLLTLAAAPAQAEVPPADTTHVLEIPKGWEYGPAAEPPAIDRLPEAWQPVELPHARGPEPCGFYRASFAVPAAWAGYKVTLVIRPLGGTAWAWLNGQALGARAPTALDVRLDATKAARPGARNSLLIALSAPADLDRGGLAACWLEATGAVGVDRLAVSTLCLAQGALVDVSLDVANRGRERFEGKVELALEPAVEVRGQHPVWRKGNDVRLDPGQSVALAYAFEPEPPRFWRFDAPFLYRLTATVRTREDRVVHTTTRRLGVRSVEVANGRWLVGGEWVRLAGTALRARGATLLCTQPGQASAAAAKLAQGPPADELLDFCDEAGAVVLLDAPACADDAPGWREALGDLAAEAALHPCVWGWVVEGKAEAYPAALARLRDATPRLPIGRPMPDLAADAKGFDFLVSRFSTRAVSQDDDGYGRRLDDLARDAAGKAIVAIDRLTAAEPGDRAAVDRSIARRRGEAERRGSPSPAMGAVAILGLELDPDEELLRIAAARLLCPFVLQPPNHEARLDGATVVLKSRFEVGMATPVAGRLPCYSLAGYQLVWRAGRGDAQIASGSIALPTIRTRTIEGWPAGPGRGETEWRLDKPGDLDFAAELQNAAGHVVARHAASLAVKVADGKVELRIGPPTKAEAPPQAAPQALIPREAVVRLDLAKLLNNDGISSDPAKKDGNFDLPNLASGSGYPADQLPASGAELALKAPAGLVFRFPDKADGKPNNLRCTGQRIDVPAGIYATLWLLAAADTNNQEGAARLVYEKGEEPAALRVTDWCQEPKLGETEAVRCTARHTWDGKREDKACRIWAVAAPLRREPLKAIELPKNERIHVFAATLVRATETESTHADALAYHFNNDGISWKANPTDGNFDLMGRGTGASFIADLLPKGATVGSPTVATAGTSLAGPASRGTFVAVPGNDGVTFRFPSKDDRARNNVLCDGQRLAFAEPFQSFDAAWFLGACHDGARAALLSIEYEDGFAQGELRLADWCAKPAAGELDILRMPARHNAEGKEEAKECGLVAWRVPLDPRRKLVAITLPRERNMHVFALTFARTRIAETKNP